MITDNKYNLASALEGLAFNLYLIAHLLLSSRLRLPQALVVLAIVSAISKFNVLVSPSDFLTVQSSISSPLFQHALSKKLDGYLFQSMLMTSSPANEARLLSASAPHAHGPFCRVRLVP